MLLKIRSIAVILVSLLIISSVVLAQLPPLPPLPDPLGLFGGNQADIEEVADAMISSGVRQPAGVPPYGLTPSGEVFWPIPEPAPAKISANRGEAANTSPAAISSPSLSGQTSVENHNEATDCMAARNSFEGKSVRPMISKTLTAGTVSNVPGKPLKNLTEKDIKALQHSFMYDLQRHSKFAYEGKNNLAAAISYKWKLIGALHADKIDEITFKIAEKNNFSKFSLWIESVIEEDKKFTEAP